MANYGESKSTFRAVAKRGAVLVMALAITVGTAVSAFAASTDSSIVVKIPFAFTVGKSNLPAGAYTLTEKENNVLQIRGAEGSVFVLGRTVRSEDSSQRATVVFHRYGDRYFLAGVKSSDGESVIKAAPSADEQRLAASGARPQTVTIARTGDVGN